MAYDDLKVEFGRRPVHIIELFLQKCLLTYGILPCEAVLGVTGASKCFNTLNTCQDVENFDPSTAVPLRFSSQRVDEIQLADEAPTFPTVISVDTTPTKLEPGKGLGIRSSLKVTLQDHPWTDVGIDPYLGEPTRPVSDPDSTGSFWGKLLARNKFWEGRRIDILTGYLEQDGTFDAANFLRRTYLVEAIAGPDRNGNVSIVAKDPLKFADTNRKKIPEPTAALLDSDIDDNPATTIVPLGTGEGSLFAVDDFIRVDEEIMKVLVITVDDLKVTRATLPAAYPVVGTKIAAHDAGATVQICKLFEDARVDDIVSNLLITEAGVDPTFIDLVEWADTFDAQIPTYIFTALITEPTGIQDLLQELTEHTILLWWDDREQEVRFEVLRPSSFVSLPVFDDDSNLIADSFASSRISKERISRVFTYFGQTDPTEDLNKRNNFQQVNARVDLDAETDQEYGSSRILDIFSRWMPVAKAAVADEIGQRLLIEYRNTKIVAQFVLDPKDDDNWTGDFVRIKTRLVQDENGQPEERQYRIIQANELLTPTGARYQYQAIQTQLNGRVGVWAPDEDPPSTPYPDYPAASQEQRLRAFWTQEDGKMSNGDDGYVWS